MTHYARAKRLSSIAMPLLVVVTGCAGPSEPEVARLVVTTETLPPAESTVPYAAGITATGGTGSYSWTILEGRLPDSLTLDPTSGSITGLAFGWPRSFVVQVVDQDEQTDTASLDIDFAYQVIEDTDFAMVLGIDLGVMERLSSGVYREDVIIGQGSELLLGMTADLTYEGWLSNGRSIGGGSLTLPTNTNRAIPGLEEGILGQRVSGRRLVVVPPALGYGAAGAAPAIPSGAITIWIVTLTGVS